ncbi:MAG: hypothetical protein OEU50_07680 [Gammaproteobacteria bacterium]|nr:hypothetical protein [Gammaproteobacteria bacterium]
MTIFRIIVGLILAFIVSTINGVSGIGYTVGGEFEVSIQAALKNGAKDDPRWQNQENGADSTMSPRNGLATLSLLLESKFGRFGLFLQVFCLLQFIAGLLVAFRSTAGVKTLTFLILIAITGASVEILGAQYSSTWGITNILGIIVSAMLVPVTLIMYKNINERDEPQEAA